MTSDRARRVLTRLAGDRSPETASESTPATATGYGGTIEEACAALDDIEAASEFVDTGGLERLADAVERAEGDLSERASEGRETLRTYRTFRAVARGSGSGDSSESSDER